MEELKNYKLNSKKTLETLNKYGIINGGGRYTIEYARGNYIYFSPNSYNFIECSGWYRDCKIDYKSLLNNKIKQLKENKIIVKKKVISK